MRKIIHLIIISLIAVGTLYPIGTVDGSTARNEVCRGVGVATSGSGCANGDSTIQGIIRGALNIISIVVGVAAVAMILLAAFRYITAAGDASKIASAQNSIIWAVVGLVVAGLAQVIVRFVLARVPT